MIRIGFKSLLLEGIIEHYAGYNYKIPTNQNFPRLHVHEERRVDKVECIFLYYPPCRRRADGGKKMAGKMRKMREL